MDSKELEIYAVKHKDNSIVKNSRSGGFFTAVSDFYLNDGVIYGCVLSDDLEVIHIRTDNKIDRDLMRGSKYVQSKLNNCFRKIKEDLDSDRKVLFTGTSCQVSGLKLFLKKEYPNLFCVDIICHGVPSPGLWQEYIKWLGNVNTVNFRNKELFGWRDHVETIFKRNGKVVHSRVWSNLFYSDEMLRPSCYCCPYKSFTYPSDITIADYWGIEKAAPEFDDNKGTSLVLINTEKGKDVFNSVKNNLIYKPTLIVNSIQFPMISSCAKPDDREKFWNEYFRNGFDYIAKKYGRHSLIKNQLRKIKLFLFCRK